VVVAHAVIIGAGIAGLTSAVSLNQRGWSVTVVEKAASLDPVGTAIALAPNAMRALDVLGIGDEVRAVAQPDEAAGIRTPSGRWLMRMPPQLFAARFGEPVYVTLRHTLVDILTEYVGDCDLQLNCEALQVDPLSGAVETTNGSLTADLIVGADGIWSRTRTALFPAHPRPAYTGLTAWRAVAVAPGVPIDAGETWGRGGQIVGVAPVRARQGDDLVYIYATDKTPPGQRSPDEKEELRRRFAAWHQPIPQILESLDRSAILRNDLYSLRSPLPAMHRGRTVVMGDAAHPMTPHLGQGGCQAIEDAVVLAETVTPGVPTEANLEAYTAARLARTSRITKQSLRYGQASLVGMPVAAFLRNATIRAAAVSPQLSLRLLDDVMRWRPDSRAS
jgi:2-polyprenyl-6-methoxyphenol hydroxylase-like FAD-dependent oxidoreductase